MSVFTISNHGPCYFMSFRKKLLNQMHELISQVERVELRSDWTIIDGWFLYKGRIYLLPTSLIFTILSTTFHDIAHEGIQKTMHRIREDFYQKGMKSNIATYMSTSPTCEHNKSERLSPRQFASATSTSYTSMVRCSHGLY